MLDEFEKAALDRIVGTHVSRMTADKFNISPTRELNRLLSIEPKVDTHSVFRLVAKLQSEANTDFPLSGSWATLLHTYPSNLREPSADLDFLTGNQTVLTQLNNYAFAFVGEWGAWSNLIPLDEQQSIRVDINHVDFTPPTTEISLPTELGESGGSVVVVKPIRIIAGKLVRTWFSKSPRKGDILDISSYLLRSAKEPDILSDFITMLSLNDKAMEAFKLLGIPNSLIDLVDPHVVSQIWAITRRYKVFQ